MKTKKEIRTRLEKTRKALKKIIKLDGDLTRSNLSNLLLKLDSLVKENDVLRTELSELNRYFELSFEQMFEKYLVSFGYDGKLYLSLFCEVFEDCHLTMKKFNDFQDWLNNPINQVYVQDTLIKSKEMRAIKTHKKINEFFFDRKFKDY